MPIKRWPDWGRYIKDRCRCQYCDLDGAQDIRLYRQMQIDHLIPDLLPDRDVELNKVVACRGCNCMKGSYDPSGGGRVALTEATRPMLIAAARKHVEERYRKNWDLDYEEMMRAIRTPAA